MCGIPLLALSFHEIFTIFTCKSAAFLLSTAEYSAEGMPDGQTDTCIGM